MAASHVVHVEPTDDNKAHFVYIATTNPNPIAGARRTSIHRSEFPHLHNDECTFCAAFCGEPPAPVASVVNEVIPRKYRLLVKAVLFPCFLLLCAEMLQWGWSITLPFLQSKAIFDADFAAHTIIKETQAADQFVLGILFAVLAILYVRAW
ncbi:hypothetical protein Q7P35_005146 [Cladosporium inversicolor]